MTKKNNGSDGSGNMGILGNTKTRISASLMWCFTLNNWTEDERALVVSIGSKFGIIFFGEEVGEKGTPHLQGFFKFDKKGRPMETFNKIPRIHWEKAKGNLKQNIKYCSKSGNNIFCNVKALIPKKSFPIKQFEPIILRPWQEEAMKCLTDLCNDDRKILWIYDDGGTGKSYLARYLVEEYNSVLLSGASKYCLSTVYKMEEKPDCIIYAFPRDKENYVSYGSLESLRDGLFFSGFGVEGTGMCNLGGHPLVIVLCNFKPDRSKFTEDRWMVKTVAEDRLVDVELSEEDSEDNPLDG